MTVKEAFRKMREIRETSLATEDENGNPQIRLIETMLADEKSIYFVTARGKDVYRQLEKTKKAAMMDLSKDWVSIRITGNVGRLSDQKKWLDICFKNNPSLEKIYPGKSRYILEVYRFTSGSVETFSVASEPVERYSAVFGGEKLKKKGFFIHDECIECGLCKRNCPQNCISEGTPYKINQNNCLHCGLCHENCPVKAIERY